MKTKENPDYQDVQDIIWFHMQQLIQSVREKEYDAHAAWDIDESDE